MTDSAAQALSELDALTRRLRRDCPWDREQDERSIVPHTVEEAYELAEAAQSGNDARLIDELGDVLYQVHFLALLLEERGAGSLADVAVHCTNKLIRRHPHVFGEAVSGTELPGPADTAAAVRRNWDKIKESEPGRGQGIFDGIPNNFPALSFAQKAQKRASNVGFDLADVPYDNVRAELAELEGTTDERERVHELGDVLFAAVNVARKLSIDPELALRSAARRFCSRVDHAAQLAADDGKQFADLSLTEQQAYYMRGRLENISTTDPGGSCNRGAQK